MAYLEEITSDPVYQKALADYNRATQQGYTRIVRDPFRQAVIALGLDPRSGHIPGELAGYAKDLDAATVRLAGQNPMSTFAQAGLHQAIGQRALQNQLAARGILRSGAYAAGRVTQGNTFNKTMYDAVQKVLAGYNAAQGQYTDFENTARGTFNTTMNAV